jgi:type IV secretory pathway protease TraF
MTGRSAVLAATVMAIAAIGATAASGTVPRFVWNLSGSVPIGLYRVRPARDLTITTLVVAYPPEPLATWLAEGRYLPRGVPLLKPAFAQNPEIRADRRCVSGQSRIVIVRWYTQQSRVQHGLRTDRQPHECRVVARDPGQRGLQGDAGWHPGLAVRRRRVSAVSQDPLVKSRVTRCG